MFPVLHKCPVQLLTFCKSVFLTNLTQNEELFYQLHARFSDKLGSIFRSTFMHWGFQAYFLFHRPYIIIFDYCVQHLTDLTFSIFLTLDGRLYQKHFFFFYLIIISKKLWFYNCTFLLDSCHIANVSKTNELRRLFLFQIL